MSRQHKSRTHRRTARKLRGWELQQRADAKMANVSEPDQSPQTGSLPTRRLKICREHPIVPAELKWAGSNQDSRKIPARTQPGHQQTRHAPKAAHSKLEAALQGVLDKRRNSKPKDIAAVSSQRQYHLESKRPLVCWLFVLPLILIYESATLGLAGSSVRSGLDQWITYFLSGLGLGQLVILPVVATVVLLLAHQRQHDQWRVSPTVFGWMGIESLGLGLIMFWAANAVLLATHWNCETTSAISTTSQQWWQQTIALIGSGIYEEVVFRLILLTLATELVFRWTRVQHAHWFAIAVISLLFSALHYEFVNPAGSPFEWSGFLFRFTASVVFSILFLFRGLGIAVGTHVAYDLLTQLGSQ